MTLSSAAGCSSTSVKPEEFLKRVPRLARTMIFSYSPAVPGQSRLHRLSVNWVNHFTRPEVEAFFDRMGLALGSRLYPTTRRRRNTGFSSRTSPWHNGRRKFLIATDFLGAGNIGDDLMVAGFSRALKKLGLDSRLESAPSARTTGTRRAFASPASPGSMAGMRHSAARPSRPRMSSSASAARHSRSPAGSGCSRTSRKSPRARATPPSSLSTSAAKARCAAPAPAAWR